MAALRALKSQKASQSSCRARHEKFKSFFCRRHVKKICRWHIFSVDLGGYAAVASIWICAALSLGARSRPQSLSRKIADFPRIYKTCTSSGSNTSWHASPT